MSDNVTTIEGVNDRSEAFEVSPVVPIEATTRQRGGVIWILTRDEEGHALVALDRAGLRLAIAAMQRIEAALPPLEGR